MPIPHRPSPSDMPKRQLGLAVAEIAPQLNFHGSFTGQVKLRCSSGPSNVVVLPIETFSNLIDDIREGVYDWILELPMPPIDRV